MKVEEWGSVGGGRSDGGCASGGLGNRWWRLGVNGRWWRKLVMEMKMEGGEVVVGWGMGRQRWGSSATAESPVMSRLAES